jgi:uridine kinase
VPHYLSTVSLSLSWGLQVRLLRRMARDYLFRGHTASRTLSMWDNVRRGEGLWIFPFQGQVGEGWVKGG